MAGQPGAAYWIDHAVVGTNDMSAWVEWAANAIGVTPGRISGLTTIARQRNQQINIFCYLGDPSCHFGAFLQPETLPESKGLGKDMPRYGFFVRPEDVDDHLRRLDLHGIPHSGPVRTSAEGDDGTAIAFEDPDGNQFEFWAPVHMPRGAMDFFTPAKVGRISSAVYGSRDLGRTADYFSEFCGVEPLRGPEIPEDTLVLPLEGGARIVYHLVDEVDGRVTGHGPWNAFHAALMVPEGSFFPNYRHMWDGVPEEEGRKEDLRLSTAAEDALPARTGLHGSRVGHLWKETYERGDEFYDWDGHAFHFVGGISTSPDGSLTRYRSKGQGEYLEELKGALASATLP